MEDCRPDRRATLNVLAELFVRVKEVGPARPQFQSIATRSSEKSRIGGSTFTKKAFNSFETYAIVIERRQQGEPFDRVTQYRENLLPALGQLGLERRRWSGTRTPMTRLCGVMRQDSPLQSDGFSARLRALQTVFSPAPFASQSGH
jgi:hypothetical protein